MFVPLKIFPKELIKELITMIKIKKIIKRFFIILGLLVFLLIRFFVLTAMKIIKLLKEKIPLF
ncbi:hypothetical protein [Texas Phoenix palm phytoplasma]|uniref:hypothetical protein n=1 Tax=Texas Phoenix palm phytoplasma TaxID=176709 RepID=UPI00280AD2F3|nr:hypothetical protein [Texas Phoenix palm phytoplasma]